MRAGPVGRSIGGGARVGCVLDIPFRYVEASDGDYFMSRDVYGHRCLAQGSDWNLEGRSFDGVDDRIELGTASLTSGASSVTAPVKPDVSGDKAVGELKLDGVGFILYQRAVDAITFGSRGGAQGVSPGGSLTTNAWSVVAFVYTGGDKDVVSSYEVTINTEKQPVVSQGTVGGAFGKNYIGRENAGAHFSGHIGAIEVHDLAEYAPRVLQRAIQARRG